MISHSTISVITSKSPAQSRAQVLVYAMIFILVFEGLLRKLMPSSVGTLIFFLKDIFCLVGLFYVNNIQLKNGALVLFEKWKSAIMIFLPIVVFTAILDPVLAVFGLKQYLLFVVIAVLVPLAFPAERISEFRKLLFFVSMMLIPTTLVAVLQNSLPATHWLNLSVDGGSLEGFSAADYLRVSSTFSFTGQYSFFLNLATPFLAALIFWPGNDGRISQNLFLNGICCFIGAVALVVGVFITGGRSAVLGSGVCVILGLVLSAIKSPRKIIIRGLVGFGLFVLVTGTVRAAKPEFFAAYDERSSNHNEVTQSDEMQSRVQEGFMNWTNWFLDQDIAAIVFGNGLGVMSNGSEKISEYARDLKARTWGTESDLDTTLFEGGIYLGLTWTLFRLWAIFYCLKIWIGIKRKELGIVVSFFLAYVILTALLGPLGKQPPANLWLWLAVGTIAVIKNYNEFLDKSASSRQVPELSHNLPDIT